MSLGTHGLKQPALAVSSTLGLQSTRAFDHGPLCRRRCMVHVERHFNSHACACTSDASRKACINMTSTGNNGTNPRRQSPLSRDQRSPSTNKLKAHFPSSWALHLHSCLNMHRLYACMLYASHSSQGITHACAPWLFSTPSRQRSAIQQIYLDLQQSPHLRKALTSSVAHATYVQAEASTRKTSSRPVALAAIPASEWGEGNILELTRGNGFRIIAILETPERLTEEIFRKKMLCPDCHLASQSEVRLLLSARSSSLIHVASLPHRSPSQ